MRNLKKILALVLALVMSMSLVTIANAADFTDSDDISYEEAADVMNAIGIIEGFEDGSFDPDGTLTREQAATLVTRMLLGDNADRLGIESSTFKDVAVTRWSAPYIEYCASLGLIDGAGDGNFYPAGQLTGYAFAKILLTAIGYSSEKEQMTGPSWSVNVAALAMDVGLDEGLENGISSAVLSREEAAQMALNAIKTPLVAYDNDATITVNGAEVSIGSGDAYYITTTLAREQRISDEQLSNSNDYTVEFGERYFPNLRLNREADEFERPSHTWIYNGDEIGSYTDYDLRLADYTEAITGRDLYDLLGKSTIEDYSIAYYVDGAESQVIKESNMIRTNTRDYATTGTGVLTEVFVDHTNEEITITSVNTYLAVADADYNESRGELSLTVYYDEDNNGDVVSTSKIVEVEDIASITDITEGQFVLVNMAATGTGTGINQYDVVRINDVESMEDVTVTGYSTNSYVTVDGEDYDYAAKAFYDDDVLDEYNQGYLGDYTYTFYFDQYGNVIGAEIYEGEANYVFITGYDRNGSNLAVTTAEAGAIFLDGNMTRIDVDVQDTNDNIEEYNKGVATDREYDLLTWTNNGDSEYNCWFRYTVDEDEVYTLTPAENWVNEMATTTGEEVNSAAIRVGTTQSTRAYGNDESVYITVDTGAVDLTTRTGITKVNGIYTGVQEVDLRVASSRENALTTPEASIFAVYDEDRYIIGAIIVGEDINNSQNYAYILDTEAQREYRVDGDDFWDVEAVVDGEIVTLTVADYNNTINKIQRHIHDARGAMYRVTYNADEQVIEAELCVDEVCGADPADYVYGNLVNNGTAGHYDYNTRDIEPDYDAIYNVEDVNDEALKLIGRALYIGETNDYGLFMASGAPIIVVQYEADQNGRNEKLTYDVYSSVNQALNSLADKDSFSGSISAVLDDAGNATYLVLNSDDAIRITTDDGTSDSGSGDYYTYTSNIFPNGFGTLTLTAEWPDWIEDQGGSADLDFSFDILLNGEYLTSVTTGSIAADSVTGDGDKASVTWNSFDITNGYFAGLETTDELTVDNFEFDLTGQNIVIKYIDADGDEINPGMYNSVTDYSVSSAGDSVSFRPLSSYYTLGVSDYSVENGTDASGDTIRVSGHNFDTVSGGGTATVYIEPDCDDFVYIYLEDLEKVTPTYTVTGFSAADIDGAGSNDDTLAIYIGTTGTTSQAGLESGDTVAVYATLTDGAGMDASSYTVTIPGVGSVTFTDGGTKQVGYCTVDDANVTYALTAGAGVTVVDVETPTLLAVNTSTSEWADNVMTIHFNLPTVVEEVQSANTSISGWNMVNSTTLEITANANLIGGSSTFVITAHEQGDTSNTLTADTVEAVAGGTVSAS